MRELKKAEKARCRWNEAGSYFHAYSDGRHISDEVDCFIVPTKRYEALLACERELKAIRKGRKS